MQRDVHCAEYGPLPRASAGIYAYIFYCIFVVLTAVLVFTVAWAAPELWVSRAPLSPWPGLLPAWLRASVRVAPGLQSSDSLVAARGPTCPASRGIFPDRALNPRLLHGQLDAVFLHPLGGTNRELCSMSRGSRDGRGVWGSMGTCIWVAESPRLRPSQRC